MTIRGVAKDACRSKCLPAPKLFDVFPLLPPTNAVALESLWFAMQEFLAEKDCGTFMSVWHCQSRIPNHALFVWAKTLIALVVFTIYESVLYISRVAFVVTVGSSTTLLWLSLQLLKKALLALSAIISIIISQRPLWIDVVLEAEMFNSTTMHRLRMNFINEIRLFTKTLGQFVLSRSLRHVAKKLLFPGADLF